MRRTQRKLAAFHRVENTYLATFQALGALGLLLGTLGLGTCWCGMSSNDAASLPCWRLSRHPRALVW
jgi:hypothetical protein